MIDKNKVNKDGHKDGYWEEDYGNYLWSGCYIDGLREGLWVSLRELDNSVFFRINYEKGMQKSCYYNHICEIRYSKLISGVFYESTIIHFEEIYL